MFTPFRLRDLVLSNRVVVSPMCQYSAVDGIAADWHLVHLGSRAIGGAGLVMTEATGVSAEGRITPGCTGMYGPEHVTAWRRIVDFVHGHSNAKIGMQIAHAGRKASAHKPWEEGGAPLGENEGAWPTIAPSPIPWLPGQPAPREMKGADLDRVLADFVRAARAADEAGFDLLEIHAAHGYLLASFLSPLTNHRTDHFGGSAERRARWPIFVITAVRAAFSAHKPLSVRISASDWAEGGITLDDVVHFARKLREVGVDIVDVSSGGTVPQQRPRHGRLFQTPFSDRIRNEAGIPTIAVGAISTQEDINSILLAGRADLVALARGHLWDPYFTRHAAREQDHSLDWPIQYESMRRFNPRPGRRV